MTEIVAVDIGGTHARFALATIEHGTVTLGPETVLQTSEQAGFEAAWRAYAAGIGRDLPNRAAVAIAGPVESDTIRLTNNHWVLRPTNIAAELKLTAVELVNDFAAVAHAVTVCGPEHLAHLCGPEGMLPEAGAISVIGPGTGLGVALLHRSGTGNRVVATEGGHIAFAPHDEFEDQLLARLRARLGRVSVERVVAGPGLREICATLGKDDCLEDKALWMAALDGSDRVAAEALERFCRSLGSVTGDLALAHGAGGVVVAGGLGLRLREVLPHSGFTERFTAKGRFRARLAALPVKLMTHPQPGLLGAAASFASRHL
jgi:glucokinase